MFKRISVLALLTVIMLSAKTYTISVPEKTMAGSAQLKPGEYQLKVDGPQVVLVDKDGKPVETTATVETADHKFDQTSMLTSKGDGANRILSIKLGGSRNRIVFQ